MIGSNSIFCYFYWSINANQRFELYDIQTRSFCVFCSCWVVFGLAQPSNDECQFAKFLPDVSDYCSEPKEFTNTAATPDPSFPNGCVALNLQMVYGLVFFASELGCFNAFGVEGRKVPSKIQNIVVFDGCNSFVECSPGKTVDTDEFLFTTSDSIACIIYYDWVKCGRRREFQTVCWPIEFGENTGKWLLKWELCYVIKPVCCKFPHRCRQ